MGSLPLSSFLLTKYSNHNYEINLGVPFMKKIMQKAVVGVIIVVAGSEHRE